MNLLSYGTLIVSFVTVPIMDPCLQEAGTPVLGPVWVSCGGGFSPSGASKFLEDIIAHLKKSRKESKLHKSQVMLRLLFNLYLPNL